MKGRTGKFTLKAYISTMGCPKNLVDSEAAAAILERNGCEVVTEPSEADVLIVGACSFLESSWSETVEEVERLAGFKRGAGGDPAKHNDRAFGPGNRRLVLMGCLPLHREENLEQKLPDVDFFVPAGAHELLADLVGGWRSERENDAEAPAGGGRTMDADGTDRFAAFERRPLFTPPHTAYVKIAEGCSRRCSFCAIPIIRGKQATRPARSIIREVEDLVGRGVREITLLSQDVVSYRDSDARLDLAGLVGELAKTGIDWIRIFYLHPAGLTPDRVSRLFAHQAVVRYLELPVQHASDRILDLMRRSHDRAHVENLLRAIRSEFPETVVRSEVIAGFPGETEEDFEELVSFVEEFEFDSLGVFPYSREQGTDAAAFGNEVPEPLVRQRVSELCSAQEAVSFGVQARRIGNVYDVLLDRVCDPGEAHEVRGAGGADTGATVYAGRFFGQALNIDGEVFVEADDVEIGSFIRVRITESGVFDLKGELLAD